MARVIRLGVANVGGENPYFQKSLFVPNRIFKEYIESLGLVEVFYPLETHKSIVINFTDEVEIANIFGIASKNFSLSFTLTEDVTVVELFSYNTSNKPGISVVDILQIDEYFEYGIENLISLDKQDILQISELFNLISKQVIVSLDFTENLSLGENLGYSLGKVTFFDLLDSVGVSEEQSNQISKNGNVNLVDGFVLQDNFLWSLGNVTFLDLLESISLQDNQTNQINKNTKLVVFEEMLGLFEGFIKKKLSKENFVCFWKKQRILDDGGFIYNEGQYCQALEALFNNIENPITLNSFDYKEIINVADNFLNNKAKNIFLPIVNELNIEEIFNQNISRYNGLLFIDGLSVSDRQNIFNLITSYTEDYVESLNLSDAFKTEFTSVVALSFLDSLNLFDDFKNTGIKVINKDIQDNLQLHELFKLAKVLLISKQLSDSVTVNDLFRLFSKNEFSEFNYLENIDINENFNQVKTNESSFVCFWKSQRIIEDGGFIYDKGFYCQALEALFKNVENPISVFEKSYVEFVSLVSQFSTSKTNRINNTFIDFVDIEDNFKTDKTLVNKLNLIDALGVSDRFIIRQNKTSFVFSFLEDILLQETRNVRNKLLKINLEFLDSVELQDLNQSNKKQTYLLDFLETLNLSTLYNTKGKNTIYHFDFVDDVDQVLDKTSNRIPKIFTLNFSETVGTGEGT